MPYQITGMGYDPNTVGQQPGPGGWWGGAGGNRGGSSAAGIDYSATGPGASGQIGQISDLINSINRTAQTQSNQARIPQAPQLEAQSSSNIAAGLQGKLAPDVIAQQAEIAAQSGVGTGSPGGPAAQAAYLRALGLTSYGVAEQAQNDLSAAYARNPGAPIYDTSKQLITPYESAELGLQAASLANRSGGGGVAPRGGSPGYGAYDTSGAGDVGYPSLAVGDNTPVPTQAQWLASIGFTPGVTPGVSPDQGATSGLSYYTDPTTNQLIDYSTGTPVQWNTPATSTSTGTPGDYENTALYTQGG